MTHLSVYFSLFLLIALFCSASGYHTEEKRKLGIDEKQTVKVEDDGTEPKSRVRGRGICQDLLPHTPGDWQAFVGPLKLIPGGVLGVDPRGS